MKGFPAYSVDRAMVVGYEWLISIRKPALFVNHIDGEFVVGLKRGKALSSGFSNRHDDIVDRTLPKLFACCVVNVNPGGPDQFARRVLDIMVMMKNRIE